MTRATLDIKYYPEDKPEHGEIIFYFYEPNQRGFFGEILSVCFPAKDSPRKYQPDFFWLATIPSASEGSPKTFDSTARDGWYWISMKELKEKTSFKAGEQ